MRPDYGYDDEGPYRDDPQQLSLTEDDGDRLPWLESGETDDDDRGVDTGRFIAFALIATLLLAVILGALWWFTRAESASELQPEGTLIAAKDGPYKVRPSDPGGKIFEGTGDTSFAVGEGQTREGRLATTPEPTPTPTELPSAEPTPAVTPEPAPSPAPAASGVNVQVGAYATRSAAQAGWVTLQRQTDKLNGVNHRIVEGTADIGKVYRLQALPGDLSAARQLCAALKADGVACQVKR